MRKRGMKSASGKAQSGFDAKSEASAENPREEATGRHGSQRVMRVRVYLVVRIAAGRTLADSPKKKKKKKEEAGQKREKNKWLASMLALQRVSPNVWTCRESLP